MELLSVTRSFDRHVFAAVADAFGLPSHTLAWESLIAYSFVRPAAEGMLTMHQLMLLNLRQRLSAEAARDLHRLLHRLWQDRADRGETAGSTAKVAAIREAAYHGLRGGRLDAVGLLHCADTIRLYAAKTGVDGIAADLDEYLTDDPDPRLQELALCLAAESALLLGAPARAADLTATLPLHRTDDEVQARLAVAAGNALRMLGDTAAALPRYETVWTGHHGPARLHAGVWAADIHMAQGRFSTAIDLADQIVEVPQTFRTGIK